MNKIAIFGGGIGGLTVAHELSKYNNYDIKIFERNDDIGGLARSARDENGCATEICWRVFFGFYDNFFKTLSEINSDDNSSVLCNFTKYKHLNVSDSPESFTDFIYVFYNVFYGLTSCDRRLNDLDNIPWHEGLGVISSTNLMRAIGPWLGMDRYKGSFKSVIKVGMEMQILKTYLDDKYLDFVTTKPTSEAIFYPWKKHLEKNNVQINLNNSLVSVNIKNNQIYDVVVYDSKNEKYLTVKADHYVFNLPVQVLDNIIDNTPKLYQGDFKNIKKLKNNCLHHQLSFQVFFNQEINFGDHNAYLITDSPWDLIVLAYDKIYVTEICDDINAKGAWSVAVCTSYIPGIVFNKPFDNCTYEEIIIELWAQIRNSNKLLDIVKNNNNFQLSDDLVIKWSKIWKTWSFSNGSWGTTEPKFTNNARSWKIRPSFKTHIKNLYLSTAYIKETIDIFSMEAANIAGKHVANAINSDIMKPTIRDRPILFSTFRMLDDIFYNLNLPNLNLFIVIFIVVIFIILIIKFISYKIKN